MFTFNMSPESPIRQSFIASNTYWINVHQQKCFCLKILLTKHKMTWIYIFTIKWFIIWNKIIIFYTFVTLARLTTAPTIPRISSLFIMAATKFRRSLYTIHIKILTYQYRNSTSSEYYVIHFRKKVSVSALFPFLPNIV